MNEKLDDFFGKAESADKGYVIALFTDEVYIDDWNEKKRETVKTKIKERKNSLLELRVFDEKREIKLFRSDINTGSKISVRVIDDNNSEYEDYYDEDQFLDIDTTNISDSDGMWNIRAIGGGNYYLPKSVGDIGELTLKVRHYISKYPHSGKAYVSDWRCMGFEKEGDQNGR